MTGGTARERSWSSRHPALPATPWGFLMGPMGPTLGAVYTEFKGWSTPLAWARRRETGLARGPQGLGESRDPH